MSVSAAGLVAYRAGGASRRQLAWFDRSGKALGTMGAPDENDLSAPSISPDGRRVAVYRTVQGNTDIWILDGTRTSRFTFDAALDRYPIWSSDGSRIVFDSNRKGTRPLSKTLQRGRCGGTAGGIHAGQDHPTTIPQTAGSCSITASTHRRRRDLWVLPMEGDRKPWVFLKTSFERRNGAFSPNGRWVAYMSNESGRYEIYIRPFVAPATVGAVDL